MIRSMREVEVLAVIAEVDYVLECLCNLFDPHWICFSGCERPLPDKQIEFGIYNRKVTCFGLLVTVQKFLTCYCERHYSFCLRVSDLFRSARSRLAAFLAMDLGVDLGENIGSAANHVGMDFGGADFGGMDLGVDFGQELLASTPKKQKVQKTRGIADRIDNRHAGNPIEAQEGADDQRACHTGCQAATGCEVKVCNTCSSVRVLVRSLCAPNHGCGILPESRQSVSGAVCWVWRIHISS